MTEIITQSLRHFQITTARNSYNAKSTDKVLRISTYHVSALVNPNHENRDRFRQPPNHFSLPLVKIGRTSKIVFINSADPGFDFLFTKDIAGLVTQFGGANSHMAVRCAELNIPAIIGSGEKNFENWVNSNVLEIDCINKQVRIIS